MSYHSSKRKIWELVTFVANEGNSEKLKCEEIFNLEIEISNLKQALQEVITINKKRRLLKKLKCAERKLLELKS